MDFIIKIIMNNLSNILSMIAVVSGIISIIIARSSLIHTQRSMLIKESYEPILNDITENKSISVKTSKKMNFDRINKISMSYLFLAFKEKDRELIYSILEKEEKLNEYKRRVNSYAGNIIAKVFNEELKSKGFKEFIVDISIGDNKGNTLYNLTDNLYDLILNDDLSMCLASNSPLIWCEIGSNYTAISPEGIEYDSFNVEQQCTLIYLIENYLGIKTSTYHESFFEDIKKYESKIVTELKQMSEYKEAKKHHLDLQNKMNKLESEIIKRIKKLIIP
jgi:hypothetical protein